MTMRMWLTILVAAVFWVGACSESSEQRERAEQPAPAVEAVESLPQPPAPGPAEPVETVEAEPPGPAIEIESAAFEPAPAEPADELPPLLQLTMTTLDGQAKPLADYHGKVLLIVNTASLCGYTPQYAGLQALHEQFADAGLAVLGFPANNFGGQEPGTDQEIAAFCQINFGVTFDMFSKISAAGEDRHTLFDLLTAAQAPPAGAGPVRWNFEKFLVSRDGEVVGRFPTPVAPNDPAVIEAIQRELE